MKKILLVLALAVGVISVNAQTNATTARPAASAQPAAAISVSEKDNTHDFGVIPQGTPVTYTFAIKNTGKAPLVLSNVAPSCGCTTPEWPKEPIKPGASANIKVTYNAASAGTFIKNIAVTSNAAQQPQVMLYIKGEVKAQEQQAANGSAATQTAAPKKN